MATRCYPLSVDHRPTRPCEKERVELAGGFIKDGRVNDSLMCSRSFGDRELKYEEDMRAKGRPVPQQVKDGTLIVSAEPEIRVFTYEPEVDQFIILASDGLWDYVSSKRAVRIFFPASLRLI